VVIAAAAFRTTAIAPAIFSIKALRAQRPKERTGAAS
jgi:hypothetical protein